MEIRCCIRVRVRVRVSVSVGVGVRVAAPLLIFEGARSVDGARLLALEVTCADLCALVGGRVFGWGKGPWLGVGEGSGWQGSAPRSGLGLGLVALGSGLGSWLD